MERLKAMKDTLMGCIQGQMGNLGQTDTHELGEAIDMVKDLEEAMYYCAKIKELEEEEKEKQEFLKMCKFHKDDPKYYMPVYYPDINVRDSSFANRRDMDKDMGRMYYPMGPMYYGDPMYYNGNGNGSSSMNGDQSSGGNNARGGGTRGFHDEMYPREMMMGGYGYTEREMPFNLRDVREGKSGRSRRMYMESKEMHRDKEHKLKDLEKYMKELSEDLVEMVEDASPEEKQLLEKKVTSLASKIAQLNV